MTDNRSINPLANRQSTSVGFVGEEAIDRLQHHCRGLNSLNWVRGSRMMFFVGKLGDGRHAVMREGERTDNGE